MLQGRCLEKGSEMAVPLKIAALLRGVQVAGLSGGGGRRKGIAGELRLEEWNGDAIRQQIEAAALAAVDETMEACVAEVQSSRSGRAANVQVVESANQTGQGANGKWGLPPEPTGDPFWELFVEVGTPYLSGDNAKRSAADHNYPQLASRIGRGAGL